jgi:hypothetical protein
MRKVKLSFVSGRFAFFPFGGPQTPGAPPKKRPREFNA